jgi:hypothetical protein
LCHRNQLNFMKFFVSQLRGCNPRLCPRGTWKCANCQPPS